MHNQDKRYLGNLFESKSKDFSSGDLNDNSKLFKSNGTELIFITESALLLLLLVPSSLSLWSFRDDGCSMLSTWNSLDSCRLVLLSAGAADSASTSFEPSSTSKSSSLAKPTFVALLFFLTLKKYLRLNLENKGYRINFILHFLLWQFSPVLFLVRYY